MKTSIPGPALRALACARQHAGRRAGHPFGAWPAKPVKIMVGANAGGGTDIIARMLADKYQAAFGQPFVVENKPGASNTIAADLTAKAAARRPHAARRDQHRRRRSRRTSSSSPSTPTRT